MIKYYSIASGSKGNSAIISDGISAIILDCGIPIKDIIEFLRYHNELPVLKIIKKVFISHMHNDHMKYVAEYENYFGLNNIIYPKEYNENLDIIVGDFIFRAFFVEHNVYNLGYLITYNDDKFLWYTDAVVAPNIIAKNYTAYFVEANHTRKMRESRTTLDVKLQLGRHSSLEETIHFINNNAGPATKHLHLLHLTTYYKNIDASIDDFMCLKALTMLKNKKIHVSAIKPYTYWEHGDKTLKNNGLIISIPLKEKK